MKLKSFGCSFVWGSELPDCIDFKDPSMLSWPARLAHKIGYQYECLARPGSGNLFIANQILTQIQTSNDPSLFVINWTWIDRFDYIDPRSDQDWRCVAPAQWRAILPVSESPEAIHYYKTIHSQFRDKLQSLILIYTCIQELDRRGIPYISCMMDPLTFENEFHHTPAMQLMQEYLAPRTTWFDGKNFLEWAKSHNYKTTPTWHLLQEGNEAAADYLLYALRSNQIPACEAAAFVLPLAYRKIG
jgi:hypothetical protein